MIEERYIQESARAGASASKRTPQVVEALQMTEKSVEVAHKLLDELQQKLAPVLRNEPALAAGSLKEQETVVEMAQKINEVNSRAGSLCSRIQSITNRLEI